MASSKKKERVPDAGLPEFERPPVAEVVLGIQFDPVVEMAAAHLGAVWGIFRNEFPKTEDRHPLASTFEKFDAPREKGSVQLNLELGARPPLPRCWFINKIGDEVLQLQPDRFLHNWRKVESQPNYPRYANLRSKFETEISALHEFIAREKIGELTPNQCEVTYINHIATDQNWSEHREAGKLFRLLADAGGAMMSEHPEHVRFDTAFPMKDDEGAPCGRLHASVVSGFFAETRKPMYAMTLTARGAPIGSDLAGAFRFLDLGHQWVVNKFAALTTPSMHVAWGRQR